MKALILGALIALTPVSATAQTQNIPIQHTEILPEAARTNIAALCIGIASKKITGQEVINHYKLDTQAKQQQFVDACMMYFQGLQDGVMVARDRGRDQSAPEAATN